MEYSQMMGQAQNSAGEFPKLSEVQGPLTSEAIGRTHSHLEATNDTIKVLTGLRDRLFGPSPTSEAVQGSASNSAAGNVQAELLGLHTQLARRLNTINMLSNEIANRL